MPWDTMASTVDLTMCSLHGSSPNALQRESVHHEFHPIGGVLAIPLLYARTAPVQHVAATAAVRVTARMQADEVASAIGRRVVVKKRQQQ